MASIVESIRQRLAARQAGRPERRRRQAEAKAHRLQLKRRHESDPRGGAGGGG